MIFQCVSALNSFKVNLLYKRLRLINNYKNICIESTLRPFFGSRHDQILMTESVPPEARVKGLMIDPAGWKAAQVIPKHI